MTGTTERREEMGSNSDNPLGPGALDREHTRAIKYLGSARGLYTAHLLVPGRRGWMLRSVLAPVG